MFKQVKKIYSLMKVSFRAEGLVKALYWTAFGYVNKNEFVIFRAQTGRLKGPAGTGRLEVRPAVAEDLRLIQKAPEFQTREAFIDRFRKYDSCLLGYYDTSPAHIMWIFRQGDQSRFFSLGPGEAEINYCYTSPEFRGKGIYPMMIASALRLLRKGGVKTVYMATHRTNVPAIKAISRAGFERVGSFSHYGIFYRPKWKGASRGAASMAHGRKGGAR